MKNILSTTEGQKGANREGQRGKGQECNNILNGFSFHPLERAVNFLFCFLGGGREKNKDFQAWGGGDKLAFLAKIFTLGPS